MKLQVKPLFLVLSLVACAGCADGIDLSTFAQAQARGTFERTLAVDGPVELSVRTGSGDIDIRTGTDGRLQIVGRITAGHRVAEQDAADRIRQIEATPPIQQTANVIRIGDTHNDPRYRDISISYELIVPANTQITSQTGSGDQTIGSVSGAVRAQTGSGDIGIERIGGKLDAQTGSGDIRVSAVAGAVRAQTGSGDVEVAQISKADVAVHTGSGDVRLTLPTDAAFTLTARTGSGSIDTLHPLQVQGEQRRNRVQGTVRGGGNRVDVATGSGSIRIR
jgi:DUF4097 and DUF4098 domain-containing protein YvlB